jgi:hypothetical protein
MLLRVTDQRRPEVERSDKQQDALAHTTKLAQSQRCVHRRRHVHAPIRTDDLATQMAADGGRPACRRPVALSNLPLAAVVRSGSAWV